MKHVLLALVLLGTPTLPLSGGRVAAQAVGVAIVVHPDAPVTDLTMDELRRIFLAEQQFWSNGMRITLLIRAPQAYERDIVLNHIYGMDEDRFRQYWVAKIFRAEIPAGPKIVYSSDMARELVTVIPGAITFMPSAEVDSGVRVVRIEGRLPDEPGYALR